MHKFIAFRAMRAPLNAFDAASTSRYVKCDWRSIADASQRRSNAKLDPLFGVSQETLNANDC